MTDLREPNRRHHRIERRLAHERLRSSSLPGDDLMDSETSVMRHRALRSSLSPSRPPFVLLAEDDPGMRDLVASALRKDGCVVRELSSGVELLIEIETLVLDLPSLIPVDLILSDVCMPGFSGLDLLEDVRGAEVQTPFILMTAFGSDEVREAASALGAGYLEKPFRLTALRMAVASRIREARGSES